ncbi:MAG: 3-hydroxyacyl-ACP dehydratase FabZ, partial [Lentisphaerae bacterium]|nr:3-hydroxyacyl-ACP dehydratase FabZ [Lentisphaerota bacterium]
MSSMDIDKIMSILPHRYPFLLVDKVLECDDETRIVGIKNVTINEPYFQGHFPSFPIMPGVLQLEAMAQVGGILICKKTKVTEALPLFMAVDKAKFRTAIRPGDQLRIE